MSNSERPDQIPDQIPGAPHPRSTFALFGQSEAEATFLQAFAGGRSHHAWMLCGPMGIGKATLAYRIARFLLSRPVQAAGMFAEPEPETLEISPEHPVARRICAQAEPGLRVVTRSVDEKTKRLRAEISVKDIRALAGFFQLSQTDGGRRIVIVDSADDMNVAAANALLKMLEEPPSHTTFLLIAHQPTRLLPTIRSRCRTLRCAPLDPDPMQRALAHLEMPIDTDASALSELASGSVGRALHLQNSGGVTLYGELITLLHSMPSLERQKAVALCDSMAGAQAREARELFVSLLEIALSRLARQGASGHARPQAATGESETFAKLAPDFHGARLWAERASDLLPRLRQGLAANLDPAALLLDTLVKLNDTASEARQRIDA